MILYYNGNYRIGADEFRIYYPQYVSNSAMILVIAFLLRSTNEVMIPTLPEVILCGIYRKK